MDRFKRILKKIFVLSPVPTVVIALFGYAFVIAVTVFGINIPAVEYLSYLASAYALIVTITGLPRMRAYIKSVKKRFFDLSAVKRIKETKYGGKYFDDIRFRAKVSLYCGLLINVLYIAVKMFSGIYYRSVWFAALAIYYILLAVMRFMLIRREKRHTGMSEIEIELHRYRACGITLLIMNEALAGIVIFMVYQNRGFDYPGLLIYAMAMYSFYAVISAVVNLVKFRKHGSPVLSASKTITLIAAMVSMLSLETAMLSRFGSNDTPQFRAIMTGATGGGVCTIVICMAVYMIVKANKNLKKLKINNSQT